MTNHAGSAPRSSATREVAAPGKGAVFAASAGLLAALGAASCCVLPAMIVTLGFSGAIMGSISLVVEPFEGALLAVAALFVLGAALLSWRRNVACSRTACTKTGADRFVAFAISASLVLIVAAVAVKL